jgi:Domain of Unknown Function (DUF1206)
MNTSLDADQLGQRARRAGYRGVSEKYLEHWRTGEMSSVERTWGTRISLVGLLARRAVFGLIGVFVIKAALEYDPKEAVGLDGALRRLAGHAYGTWLLGLVAYAVFCLLEARYRESERGRGERPRPPTQSIFAITCLTCV